MLIMDDDGPGSLWVIVLISGGETFNLTAPGISYYHDEAAATRNTLTAYSVTDKTLTEHGYSARTVAPNTRYRYAVVFREDLRRAGLITDHNEFGEVSP